MCSKIKTLIVLTGISIFTSLYAPFTITNSSEVQFILEYVNAKTGSHDNNVLEPVSEVKDFNSRITVLDENQINASQQTIVLQINAGWRHADHNHISIANKTGLRFSCQIVDALGKTFKDEWGDLIKLNSWREIEPYTDNVLIPLNAFFIEDIEEPIKGKIIFTSTKEL